MTSTSLLLIPPKRILVVEDEPLVAYTLRKVLSVEGHQVEVAGDGETALAMFENGDHDLVITDFKLPKMDGLELAKAVKERVPSRPIILITAHAEALLGLGNVSNVDNLLGKPFCLAELSEALKKIFSVSSLLGKKIEENTHGACK